MTLTSITNFRKNVFSYMTNAIKYNDPVFVATKDGNAVVLSEEEYNGMLATLELAAVPGMVERINAAAEEPDAECVPMEDVEW